MGARSQNAQSDKAGGWKEFAPAGGGFKILFPEEPKREESAPSVYAGRWRAETRNEGAAGGVRFQVMYVESGPGAPAESGTPLLQVLRLTTLNELRGRVLTDAAISFDGRPGRLLEIAVEGAGHARVILVAHGQRAYRLDVTAPGDSEGERVTSANFFQSFVALPVQAKPPDKGSGEVDKLLARESFEVVDGGTLNSKEAPAALPSRR